MKTMNYISYSKNIAGGEPVIKGTRIPVTRLQFLVKSGYNEKNIKQEFSGIPLNKIRGALGELTEVGLENLRKL